MNNVKTTVLSVEEFALEANITLAHTRQLLREGKLKGTKIGKEWRITREDAHNYLGIKTDIQSIEKQMYIKELEAKIQSYELQISTFKNIVGTLGNIVGI